MSDYMSTLPLELVHKILDYVSTLDILLSICLVNRHLRQICLVYPRFHVNFSSSVKLIDMKQFDFICKHLNRLKSQIISLTLFDEDDSLTPIKNELFYSRFNTIKRNLFFNLRSITLTSIEYNTWNLLKTQISSSLNKLSIHLIHSDEYTNALILSNIFLDLLLISPNLKYLFIKIKTSFQGSIDFSYENSFISSSVQYLHIEGVTIDLTNLLSIVPRLDTLEIITNSNEDSNYYSIQSKIFHIKKFHFEFNSMTWLEMKILIKSFPNLESLILIGTDLNDDMANGYQWEDLLKNLIYFQFQFQFYWEAFSQRPIDLNSFRTTFWLEEKQWFVTYDRSIKNGFSILYSNPFLFDKYPSHEMTDIVTSESTGTNRKSFLNVKFLTISYQYMTYSFFDRYIHLNELYLSPVSAIFPMTFTYLTSSICNSQIVKCSIDSSWIKLSSDEVISFLRTLSCLRVLNVTYFCLNTLLHYQWSNIVNLKIENEIDDHYFHTCSFGHIQSIYHSFPSLRQLDIYSLSMNDLPKIFNHKVIQLNELVIRKLLNMNHNKLFMHKWIKQNTNLKRFHCQIDENSSLNLWF